MKALLFTLSLIIGTETLAQEFLYKGRLVPGTWVDEWSTALEAEVLAQDLYSHNDSVIDGLCAGYREDETKRKIFWHQFFISLAWKEALHGPGNYIYFNGGINKGLYQINPKLLGAYGCGNIDLYNGERNIECGVKMARKLLNKHGAILTGTKGGLAAYWQPLRATNATNRRNREWILSNVRQACANGTLVYHSRDAFDGLADDGVDTSFNGVEDLDL